MKLSLRTFPGGIHPHEVGNGKSATFSMQIIDAPVPKFVAIPLCQHIGETCSSIVRVGDRVLMGQKIGDASGRIDACIHSSLSGKVKSIELRTLANGNRAACVIIENDFLDELDPSIKPFELSSPIDTKALVNFIHDAGIVGLGGAAFPTSVKLSPPAGKKIDYIILNGAECEPNLTCDHRQMLDNSSAIIDGLQLCMQITAATKGYIGIESNKPDCIKAMKDACNGTPYEVITLATKYPQGGEKQLIQAITGREVPSGKLPADAGCIVINVSTAAAISTAVRTGMPLIEKVITMTGSIDKPCNLRVRIGTSVAELIDYCGGMNDKIGKVIIGGPMMGTAIYDLDTPIIKGSSGILLIEKKHAKVHEQSNCIRCGRCADICPAKLQPLFIDALVNKDMFAETAAYSATDCIECGSCSYVCPAKRPLKQTVTMAKNELFKIIRAQKK